MEPKLNYWRDPNLDDACLLKAEYGSFVWERHVHEELVISVSENGTGVCETRGGADQSGPGSFWVFAPGEAHAGHVEQGWNYRGLYLGENALAAFAHSYDTDRRPQLHLPPGLYHDEQLAAQLLDAHCRVEAGAPLLERQVFWGSALYALFTRYGKPKPEFSAASVGERYLRIAKDYMETHFREDVSVDDLARRCGLSRFHFMRSFRARYGIAPHAFLNQVRINRARRLLADGWKAADVAVDAGFYDQSALTRYFKRAFGVTPARYAELLAR